jgi:predicted permease
MALGIGANTAVFSVVNSVLLKPLDYRDPDRIVRLSSAWKRSSAHGQVSAPDFHDWHDQSTSFDAMAYYADETTAIMAGAAAEYGHAAAVTPDFFRVFDMAAVAGRLFTREEEQDGGPAAVVISHSFWQSHYGGNSDALGQTVRIESQALRIVGVLPPRFHFPDQTDLWIPAAVFGETPSRSAHNYLVVGRLNPGVTLAQAQAQMTAIGSRLEQQYPGSNKDKGVLITPLQEELVGDVRATLYVLLSAVALVLLIACANMANLLLARATARTREMAIRAAIGAGRSRIIRQLIVESMVLALSAGAAGLMLGLWGVHALIALAPADTPRLSETSIDGTVLAFTFLISVAASLLFGLAPAIQASRIDLSDALKQGGVRSGGGSGRMRAALVTAEIAMSVVLVAGAGLLLKSFIALHNVALGFRPEKVLLMSTAVPYSGPADRHAADYYQRLLSTVNAMPGVRNAGATRVPPGGVSSWGTYSVDRVPQRDGASAVFSVIAPRTLDALAIPLRYGRDFNDSDTYDAPRTVLVNEALVKRSFPNQDPIGHTITCGLDKDSTKPMRIVGVVADIRQRGPAERTSPEIFMPYQQHPRTSTQLTLVIHTLQDPTTLSETLRRTAQEISPEVPVKFTTLEARIAANVAAPRFRTVLIGIFAVLALSLAMAGVYGVMAYTVGRRSGEIGVRMALGASTGDVLRLILRQGLAVSATGLAIGVAGALAATRALSNMMFGVKPTDPLTYIGVIVLLAMAALAASYFPARRATRIDPLAALREE